MINKLVEKIKENQCPYCSGTGPDDEIHSGAYSETGL